MSPERRRDVQRRTERTGERRAADGSEGGLLWLERHLVQGLGVCSTANLGLVKSLGADRVIDYTKEDFAKGGEDYDIIFDTVGKTSFSRCKGSLQEGGVYVSTLVALPFLLQSVWTSIVGGKRAVCAMSVEKNEALVLMKELIEAGRLKPVIDSCYPLEQIAEAHRYVDTGRKRGSVAIAVAPEHRA